VVGASEEQKKNPRERQNKRIEDNRHLRGRRACFHDRRHFISNGEREGITTIADGEGGDRIDFLKKQQHRGKEKYKRQGKRHRAQSSVGWARKIRGILIHGIERIKPPEKRAKLAVNNPREEEMAMLPSKLWPRNQPCKKQNLERKVRFVSKGGRCNAPRERSLGSYGPMNEAPNRKYLAGSKRRKGGGLVGGGGGGGGVVCWVCLLGGFGGGWGGGWVGGGECQRRRLLILFPARVISPSKKYPPSPWHGWEVQIKITARNIPSGRGSQIVGGAKADQSDESNMSKGYSVRTHVCCRETVERKGKLYCNVI